MTLIKKKDVKSYFAARRNRHPLDSQTASVADATGFSAVERGTSKASSVKVVEAPKPGVTESPVPAFVIGPSASAAPAPPAGKSSLA